MRISDWSSDVCSSDLNWIYFNHRVIPQANSARSHQGCGIGGPATAPGAGATTADGAGAAPSIGGAINSDASPTGSTWRIELQTSFPSFQPVRSEEHTSELQSLMRISYAVFCLKKKKQQNRNH